MFNFGLSVVFIVAGIIFFVCLASSLLSLRQDSEGSVVRNFVFTLLAAAVVLGVSGCIAPVKFPASVEVNINNAGCATTTAGKLVCGEDLQAYMNSFEKCEPKYDSWYRCYERDKK